MAIGARQVLLARLVRKVNGAKPVRLVRRVSLVILPPLIQAQ